MDAFSKATFTVLPLVPSITEIVSAAVSPITIEWSIPLPVNS
jgi:hypothetical protein